MEENEMLICKKDKKHKEFILLRTQVYKAIVDEEYDEVELLAVDCVDEKIVCAVCGSSTFDDEVDTNG